MRSTLILPLLAGLATAQTPSIDGYTSLKLTNVATFQPSGALDGNANSWSFSMDVSSTNGDNTTGRSAHCSAAWPDNDRNCGDDCVPYSTKVPTDWMTCGTSNFEFQLLAEFEVGSFQVQLIENITDSGTPEGDVTMLYTNPVTINNVTDAFICDINGSESTAEGGTHAFGSCNSPTNTSFSAPIVYDTDKEIPEPSTPEPSTNGTSTNGTSTNGTSTGETSPPLVSMTFPVLEVTEWYDHLFVVGNISELGNWSPYHARALSALYYLYTDSYPIWTGGYTQLEPGTPFEYKYILWTANGTLVWECGENRVATTPNPDAASHPEGVYESEGSWTMGDNPNHFQCGQYSS